MEQKSGAQDVDIPQISPSASGTVEAARQGLRDREIRLALLRAYSLWTGLGGVGTSF
jgi:hypothetical protein